MRFTSFLRLVVVVAVVVVCFWCCCCRHMEPFKQFQCWSDWWWPIFMLLRRPSTLAFFCTSGLHTIAVYRDVICFVPPNCVSSSSTLQIFQNTNRLWHLRDTFECLTLWHSGFRFLTLDPRDATSWYEWSIKVRQVSNTTETQLKQVTDIREASCWSVWCTHGNDTTEHSVEERDRSVGRA